MAMKNKNFTPLKISDNSVASRRVSYCEVASKKPILVTLNSEQTPKVDLAHPLCRKGSATKTSIFENTEASTLDFTMSKMSFKNQPASYVTPIKIPSGQAIRDQQDVYSTPIKQNIAGMNIRTRSNHIFSRRMTIQNTNVSSSSIIGSEAKTHRQTHLGKSSKTIPVSRTIKRKVRLRRKLKTRSVIRQSIINPTKTHEKRLNLRNKELHVAARPYTELKDEVGKDRQREDARSITENYIESHLNAKRSSTAT